MTKARPWTLAKDVQNYYYSWSRDSSSNLHCPSENGKIFDNQGYHHIKCINWDNPGYPGLETCGPERVGTGAPPTARRRRGEHISLIFVQCWKKTSLHCLGHRGCHCRISAACEESQPSKSAHLQLQGTISKVGVQISAYLSYSYALHFQVLQIFYAYIVNIIEDDALHILRHTVLTNFAFFRRVTCREPRIGTRKASEHMQ